MTAPAKHPHHSLGVFVAVLGVVAVISSVFSLRETQRESAASVTGGTQRDTLRRLQMRLVKLHGVATSSALSKVDNAKIGTYKKIADCPSGAQCLEWRNGVARPRCKGSDGSCTQAILGAKCGVGNYGESYFCFSCGTGSPDSSNHACP